MTVSDDERFVVVDLDDPEEVRAAAGQLVSVTGAAETSMERMQGTWEALESQYSAPEAAELLGALARPRRDAQEYSAAGEAICSALHLYADRLEELVRRRSRLVADVATFVEQGVEGAEEDDWEAREERIGELQRGCHGLAADKDAAQEACAAMLMEITTSTSLPRGGEVTVPWAREASEVPVPDQTFGEWVGDVFSLTPSGGFGGESAADDAVWAGSQGATLSGAAADFVATQDSPSGGGGRAWAPSAMLWGTMGKVLGLAGTGFSGVAGGMGQWGEDSSNHPQMETPEQVARAVTVGGFTVVGGMGGGKLGLMSGSSIGSLIQPGTGSVVGGILGGLFGSTVGGYGGRAVGEWAKGPVGHFVQDAYDAASPVVDDAYDAAGRAVDDAMSSLEELASSVPDPFAASNSDASATGEMR